MSGAWIGGPNEWGQVNGLAAFHLGKQVFSLSVLFALHASNFDAEILCGSLVDDNR